MEQPELPRVLLVELEKGGDHFQKVFLFKKKKFLIKLNIHLPFDPGLLPPGIYPRATKAHIHKITCTEES